MLAQVLDVAVSVFGSLRSKIDEVLAVDNITKIKDLWIPYKGSRNPYLKPYTIAAIDSGFNYNEYRGYVLYVLNAVSVIINDFMGEKIDGSVDIDVVSCNNIENELSLLSISMEVKTLTKILHAADIILMDGSLIAIFSKLRRASLEDNHELLEFKGVNTSQILKELIYSISIYPRKIIFISKNSNAKDVLGFVKGDIYYFERYTDGLPGHSKPIHLTHSRHLGIQTANRVFRRMVRDVAGIDISIAVSYVRFEPFSRIYRLEIPLEPGEDADTRIKHFMDVVSDFTVAGYPYPLMRADQMARVGLEDINRIAGILGILRDPRAREPL
ncbi:MAG: DNA double-strand break repair nuclease NurA [Ignisphaera sp.]|nr:DNA double-strand break repair nuclease NurA [Ignisphaera sp.]MCX8167733.1 DNA double-strand break repair nuclease NurA [Ignisphaera sp.]MDW8085297.1 DNA double-strand break repair nuclease NurA [Ignisphaera sp.]